MNFSPDCSVIWHSGSSEHGGDPGDHLLPSGVNARSVASRGALRSMSDLQSPESLKEPQGLLFKELSSQPDHSGSLVPSLDEKLDQAHRFTLLGRIFGPISDFIRRTLGNTFLGETSKDASSSKD